MANYGIGGHYEPHFDFARVSMYICQAYNKGNIIKLLLFLNPHNIPYENKYIYRKHNNVITYFYILNIYQIVFYFRMTRINFLILVQGTELRLCSFMYVSFNE